MISREFTGALKKRSKKPEFVIRIKQSFHKILKTNNYCRGHKFVSH